TMTWDNSSAITVTGMQIDGIGNVPFEPKPNGNSVEVILNKTTLADLGFTDSVFIADAEIVLRPTFFMNEYFVDLKTTYAVDYLAEGDVCNRNENSEGIIYYVQQYPNVYGSIDSNPDILQLANWCGNSYIANFTIRSVADVHQSNIIRNCYLEFTTINNYVKIDIVEVNGVVLQEDGGKWYLPINDLDGDNIHSDLYPGDSLVVKITASSLYTTPHSMFSVFLRYQRIDSDEYLQHGFSVGGFIRYTSSNISSPADINEGDVAAYTYNFTTEGDNYLNTSPHAFLNTEKIYAQFDYTGEQINQTLAVKISGAENFSATAECGMSQTARLVMVTAGCPDEKFTVTSATGNAIIQCEGEGGACYGIYTDTVEALTATEINTCQALELKAPGHIDRWCRDTCANFSKIIARVYDLSGKLSISGESSIIEINGQSIAGVLNNSYASHNGVAWVADAGSFECVDTILNHDTLTLTATIKVNGDHSLPDLSNVNLRIEFAAIDINNELLEGGWSKGLPIIVYDPETSFGADFDNYGCSGLRLHASMKNGANGAPAHPSVINSVLYPLVENYYYEKLGSNTPNTSTETTYDKSLYPGGNFTLQEALFPICVKDSTLTPSATLQFIYTDYYATCADKSFTKNLTREANRTGIALMPTLTLHPTETQQNIEDFTTWTVQVENTGTAPAKNVMLKFEV
ncbi:MAG: hypothetical protein PF486_01500, partial [Prolixibacteraceae bacterium]|nr:hypothetical protein [Prolixibacteraceae bacterium]